MPVFDDVTKIVENKIKVLNLPIYSKSNHNEKQACQNITIFYDQFCDMIIFSDHGKIAESENRSLLFTPI